MRPRSRRWAPVACRVGAAQALAGGAEDPARPRPADRDDLRRWHHLTDDARARLRAGADLVQAYTGFVYGGPLWPRRIAAVLTEGDTR